MNLMIYCKFFVVLYNNFSDDFSLPPPKLSTSLSGILLLMAFLMCVCRTVISLLFNGTMSRIYYLFFLVFFFLFGALRILTRKLTLPKNSR